jgi:hypothetical protein
LLVTTEEASEEDALYVLTAALLTPAQFPSVLGDDFTQACAALGLTPDERGYGLVLGQDGEGARWTVVVDDASLVAVAIAAWDCGMEHELSPREDTVIAALPGWPLALTVTAPGLPAPHDPSGPADPLTPPDTSVWGSAQRRLGADEVAAQWFSWREAFEAPDPADGPDSLPHPEGDARGFGARAEAGVEVEDSPGTAPGGEDTAAGLLGRGESSRGTSAVPGPGALPGVEAAAVPSSTDGTDPASAPAGTGTGVPLPDDARTGEAFPAQSATGPTVPEGRPGTRATVSVPGNTQAAGTAADGPATRAGDAGPAVSHPGVHRVLRDLHSYVERKPPVGRVRSSFAPAGARTLRADGPGWSFVARTDDMAFVLLDDEPGKVLPVGRGTELPALLTALDAMAVRPA